MMEIEAGFNSAKGYTLVTRKTERTDFKKSGVTDLAGNNVSENL